MSQFGGHSRRLTVGVFDSGFGGLTVLRALLPRLPGTHFLYLGDTARLPYGAKSQATVARYAVEAAHYLVAKGAKLLVIACNTATALALPEIRAAVAVPVIGVVEPGAEAALAASRHHGNPEVLVLATAATVQSHAYRDTCAALGLHATEMPCPLLVPLVEEGWTDHPVTREVLAIYLREALENAFGSTLEHAPDSALGNTLGAADAGGRHTPPGTVLLGCTHYPLIAPAIRKTLHALGSQATVVDSAEATAEAVRAALAPAGTEANGAESTFQCFATDSIEKFARLGSQFLGRPIPQVHLLDLGG